MVSPDNLPTATKQVQTHFDAPALSPWLQMSPTTGPRNREPVVRRMARVMPKRSVSTASFPDLSEGKVIRAAPFPGMPTGKEIQDVKAEVEQEISRYRADLSSFQHERNSFERRARPLIPPDASKGMHEYRGLLIMDTTVDAVMSENRARKAQSLQADMEVGMPPFHNLTDLPFFKQMITKQRQNVVPMLVSEYTARVMMEERKIELASQYLQRAESWKHARSVISEYSARTVEKSESWPQEFPKDPQKVDDAARLRWVAPDQEMFMTDRNRLDGCFFDMNGFVDDPQSEHDEYRDRLVWSEEERQVFIEKYRQHPKDFRKIRAALPDKSYKEVIEFYYLNKFRYELSLRENEGAARRRGGKKKVISEGNVKKSY
jgi:hypothetical protein